MGARRIGTFAASDGDRAGSDSDSSKPRAVSRLPDAALALFPAGFSYLHSGRGLAEGVPALARTHYFVRDGVLLHAKWVGVSAVKNVPPASDEPLLHGWILVVSPASFYAGVGVPLPPPAQLPSGVVAAAEDGTRTLAGLVRLLNGAAPADAVRVPLGDADALARALAALPLDEDGKASVPPALRAQLQPHATVDAVARDMASGAASATWTPPPRQRPAAGAAAEGGPASKRQRTT
jgi:hypothetical protein